MIPVPGNRIPNNENTWDTRHSHPSHAFRALRIRVTRVPLPMNAVKLADAEVKGV